MDHSTFDLMTHKLGRPQAVAQYYDPKRYPVEKPGPPNVQMDAKTMEAMLYRGSQGVEGSFPYQYSNHPHRARGYPDEVKQRLSSAPQSYASQNLRHGGAQDYPQVTGMQQRQEYMQRIAQQQQILQQREYAERMVEQNKMAATRRVRPPETARSQRNIHGYGDHYEPTSRQSAFTYTGAGSVQQHRDGIKVERRPSVEGILGPGFSSHHANLHPSMIANRGIDPRQIHNQQEQYTPQGQIPNHHSKAIVAKKLREQQALREWETQANQMYAKYAASGGREIPPKAATYPPLSPQQQQQQQQQQVSQEAQPDQLDAELTRLKTVVRQMEIMKEQRNTYKSNAFQYLEKYGTQEICPDRIAAAQPSPPSADSLKKNYPYHTMPPPPHHTSPPNKYNEMLSPQKNKYSHLSEHQQQMAYYQQHLQQRHVPANQARQHHPPSAAHKKDVNPMQLVVKGLPKIVDVRSLANGSAATVVENSLASLNSRRRSNEPLVGDNRLVRVQTSSSPEGYAYEISDTRSADSCDSGVESLASPDAQLSGNMYNRNAIALAQQQQQFEAAKAQHAASIEVMKRQQTINRSLNRNINGTPNVTLERAGSPQKLSEIMEKDKVCPSMFKGIDSLTCRCQACIMHQEKTEIKIRDLFRERKIKKFTSGSGAASSKPTPCTSASEDYQHDVILIESEENEDSRKRVAIGESDSAPETKKLRSAAATGLNDDVGALDLSKKTVTSKSRQECENTLLDLKVQSKMKDVSMTEKFLKDPHGSLTVEQVIASCMRQAEERINKCEKALLHRGKTTSFEEIITDCIDREEQGSNMKNDGQIIQQEKVNDYPPSSKDLDHVNLKPDDSSKDQSKTNTNFSKEHVENLNQDKNNGQEQDVKNCRDKIDEHLTKLQTTMSQSSLQQSIDDISLLQNQVVCTSLKVMVEKLKVNSDMIVPAGDYAVEEQTTLHRTASVPILQNYTDIDEVAARQRASSVGLSNSVSTANDSSVKYPIPRKGKLYTTPGQESISRNERPMSAPSCAPIPESNDKDSVFASKEDVTSVPKPKSQELAFIPKNLRGCWDTNETNTVENNRKQPEMQSDAEGTKFIPTNLRDCWSKSDDVMKAKELSSPKMQWKAQWAKEKKSVTTSEQSLCEVCGMGNPVAVVHTCQHKLQFAPAATSDSAQNLVKEEETKSSKEANKTISLGSLFQSKQFQSMINATVKPLPESENKLAQQNSATTPMETIHHFPVQNLSLCLIKGKQHGKATIFHKQPMAMEKRPDQTLKPATSKQSAIKCDVITQEHDKQETKQFPRLAPSPTAVVEIGNYENQEHVVMTSETCTVMQPAVQAHVKNVLRVMPNVLLPVTSSAMQTSVVGATGGDEVEVASKPQDFQTSIVNLSGKSSLSAEPMAKKVKLTASSVEQEQVIERPTQSVASASKATVVLPVEHISKIQSAAIPPSSSSSAVLSSMEQSLKSAQTLQNKQSVPNMNQSKLLSEMKSNDQLVLPPPTSVVQPMLQTSTTISVAQTLLVQPKAANSTSRTEPVLTRSESQRGIGITVDLSGRTSSKSEFGTSDGSVVRMCTEQASRPTLPPLISIVEESTKIPPPDPPVLQSSIETFCEESIVKTTTSLQNVVPISTVQMNQSSEGQTTLVWTSQETNVASSSPREANINACKSEASAVEKPQETQLKTEQCLISTFPEVSNCNVQPPVQPAIDQPIPLVTIGESNKLAQSLQAQLPKMPSLVQTVSRKPPPPPPLVLISNTQPIIKTTPSQRPLLPAPMKIQMTSAPVLQLSTVHVVTPTSNVQSKAQPVLMMQPADLTSPRDPLPQIQLSADTTRKQQQDLTLAAETGKAEADVILPMPLENVNRRLKSSNPHIHVPTSNGYSRYQKDNNNMREIYRVEMFDDTQPLDLKVVPKKKQTLNACKVVYLQHNFPCVIRSEVPFVSPQMLQEAFFAAVDYGDFTYALQKCGIMHRYMTMQEQGAMSRACVTRTWNGSCKLVPLDEFDAKYEQITALLEHHGEEECKT